MGEIVLNLAMSIDGYIARKDGSYDWITPQGDTRLDSTKQYDFEAFLVDVDIVVMGKTCYQEGFYENLNATEIFIVSNDENLVVDDERIKVYCHNEIVDKVVEEKSRGKRIFLYGGGLTIDIFMKKDVIDRFILGFIPVILGEGILLFYEGNIETKLHLDEIIVNDGIIIAYYHRRV